MHYVGIFTYQFILYYVSAIHKHTHTPILKPPEDSEPTGLKVDIAAGADRICRSIRSERAIWLVPVAQVCV